MTEIPDITEVRNHGMTSKYVIELSDRTTIEFNPIDDFTMAQQEVYPRGQRFDAHSKRKLDLATLPGVETPPEGEMRLTVLNWIEFYSSFYEWENFEKEVHDGVVEGIVMSQKDTEENLYENAQREEQA
jgi:hypothetical protein